MKNIAKSNYKNYKNNFFETGMHNAKILQSVSFTNEEQDEFEKNDKKKANTMQGINVIYFSKQRLCADKEKRN